MSHYRCLLALIAFLPCIDATGQELFTYCEPASNMPAKSVGIRLNNWLMHEDATGKENYHLIPEVMWGINKRLMLHLDAFISNTAGPMQAEGGGIYAKYRFYSKDGIYRHFRAAAFGRAATNIGSIHEDMIQINGHNTGYQAGMIATQLLHKTAISLTTYYERAYNNMGGNELPNGVANKAINYSVSVGRLLLPRAYTGYKQTNLNLMVELLGQSLPENEKYFADIAPSVQLIFNSQTRVDMGYRHELAGNMLRTGPNGFLLRMEHLLFNVL